MSGRPADVAESADVVVFNTCAVRENADNRLYGNLGQLYPVKQRRPDMQIAVGRLPRAERPRLGSSSAPRGSMSCSAPTTWRACPCCWNEPGTTTKHRSRSSRALQTFPSDLPTRRESPYSAWVSISVGCDNRCSFCIVPSLRGTEKDRRPGDVLAEVRALVEADVVEVSLLGQNVNSYGRSFGDRFAFGRLLRSCGEIDGLERVRFTSPHPRDFTDDVIAAMAETPNVCPATAHAPAVRIGCGAPGDAAVLPAGAISRHHRPGAGGASRRPRSPPTSSWAFPARQTRTSKTRCGVVRAARFASAFTFQYSPRPGTPAASCPSGRRRTWCRTATTA